MESYVARKLMLLVRFGELLESAKRCDGDKEYREEMLSRARKTINLLKKENLINCDEHMLMKGLFEDAIAIINILESTE